MLRSSFTKKKKKKEQKTKRVAQRSVLLVGKNRGEAVAEEGGGVGPAGAGDGDGVRVGIGDGVGVDPGLAAVGGVQEEGVEGVGEELATDGPALVDVQHLHVHEAAAREGDLLDPGDSTVRGPEDVGRVRALANDPAVHLVDAVDPVEVEAAGLVEDGLESLAAVPAALDDSNVAIGAGGARGRLRGDLEGGDAPRGIADQLDAGGYLDGLGGVAAGGGLGGPGSPGDEPGVVGGEGAVTCLGLASPVVEVQGLLGQGGGGEVRGGGKQQTKEANLATIEGGNDSIVGIITDTGKPEPDEVEAAGVGGRHALAGGEERDKGEGLEGVSVSGHGPHSHLAVEAKRSSHSGVGSPGDINVEVHHLRVAGNIGPRHTPINTLQNGSTRACSARERRKVQAAARRREEEEEEEE